MHRAGSVCQRSAYCSTNRGTWADRKPQGCNSDSALLMQVALLRKRDRMRTVEEEDDVMADEWHMLRWR